MNEPMKITKEMRDRKEERISQMIERMSEPMKITKEMRDRKEERISQMIDRVNKDIKLAVSRKQNSACFVFDKSDEFYFEVKKKFLDCGYKIVPTGYLNGIYQRTEDIIW